MRKLLIILTLTCLAALARAESASKCAVCQQPIAESFYWVSSPALRERQAVCKACAQLSTVCFICRLPVKVNFQKLADGRLLCERDAKVAVFSPDEAQRVFDEARRDLLAMFSGTGVLPSRNVTISLVDAAQLEQLLKAHRSAHDQAVTMGLTATRRTGQDQFEHKIHLLNGLGSARLAAVAAHEWTHTWVHENVPANRQLDGDTVEGFCELVAFKVMSQRNEEVEKKVILANAYTRGQINTLVKAESDFQFYRVVEWMKSGTDPKLDDSAADRVLALKSEPAASVVWYPEVLTPVPDALVLKGIGGPSNRRFALINNRTLEKNEMARVRVGSSDVTISCVEISDNSVLVQVQGLPTPTQLFLRPN